MFTDIFSKISSNLITFFFVGKIFVSWFSRSKNFLNPCMVNLCVCLFNILFGWNFRKNRRMTREFWHVFEIHEFALHIKSCYYSVQRSFYRALQNFQCISLFCSFLMTQIDTKFRYVLKLYRSDLHTKISHRIQYILFYRALEEFEYTYCSFLMTQIGTKFRYVFKLHWSDLNAKISHRIQHIFIYRILQKFEYIKVYCFLLKCTASPWNIDIFQNTLICFVYYILFWT